LFLLLFGRKSFKIIFASDKNAPPDHLGNYEQENEDGSNTPLCEGSVFSSLQSISFLCCSPWLAAVYLEIQVLTTIPPHLAEAGLG